MSRFVLYREVFFIWCHLSEVPLYIIYTLLSKTLKSAGIFILAIVVQTLQTLWLQKKRNSTLTCTGG